jgi:hypothetical protein
MKIVVDYVSIYGAELEFLIYGIEPSLYCYSRVSSARQPRLSQSLHKAWISLGYLGIVFVIPCHLASRQYFGMASKEV